MAESHVISALAAKRAELAGLILALERQIHQHQAALAHIDATLRLFDPTVKLTEIAPKRPAHARSPYFVQGEIVDRCRDALRAGPVKADEIAIKAMRDKGLDPADRRLRSDFVKRVHWTLERMQRHGELERIGKNTDVRWTLPKDGAGQN